MSNKDALFCSKMELHDEFMLDSEGMYEDDKSEVAKTIAAFKGPLLGVEYIVEDIEVKTTKCTLCKVILKSLDSILPHLKTSKHMHNYLEKDYPEQLKEIKVISSDPKRNRSFGQLLAKAAEDFNKRFGRGKPKVFEEGRCVVAERDIADDVDAMAKIPTSPEILKTLLKAKMDTLLDGQESFAKELLDKVEAPIIGLEYVAEYRDPFGVYEPGYLCTICEFRLSARQIARHMMDQTHRLKYMETCHKTQYTVLSFKSLNKDRREELLDKYTKEIVEKEGPGRIQLCLTVPEQCRDEIFFMHKKLPVPKKETSRKSDDRNMWKPLADDQNKDRRESGSSYTPPRQVDERRRTRSPRRDRNNRDRDRDRSHQRRSPDSTTERRRDRSPLAAGRYRARSPPPSVQDTNGGRRYDRPPSGQDRGLRNLERMLSPTRAPRAPPPVFGRATEHEVTAKRPNFVYSERAEKQKKMAAIEKNIPSHCFRDLNSGYFSNRDLSPNYVARFCSDEWWSSRCAEGKVNFYDDWAPFLMRRVQDKFNFKLEHIKWLQKLLLEAKVPLGRPVVMAHLQHLESEVETAVLIELVDETLMPNWQIARPKFDVFASYLQEPSDIPKYLNPKQLEVYKYLEDVMTPPASPPPPEIFTERPKFTDAFSKAILEPTVMPTSYGGASSLGSTIEGADTLLESLGSSTDTMALIEKLRSLHRAAESDSSLPLASETEATDSVEPQDSVLHVEETPKIPKIEITARKSPVQKQKESPVPPSEKSEEEQSPEDKERKEKIDALITQILSTAHRQSNKNPVLELLLGMKTAKKVLFKLATEQPQTLMLLVNVIKNPNLTVPAETLDQLSQKLQGMARDAEEAEESKLANEKHSKTDKNSRSRKSKSPRHGSKSRDKKESRSRDKKERSRSKDRRRRSRSGHRRSRHSKSPDGSTREKNKRKRSRSRGEKPSRRDTDTKEKAHDKSAFKENADAKKSEVMEILSTAPASASLSSEKSASEASTVDKLAKYKSIMSRVEMLRKESSKQKKEASEAGLETGKSKTPEVKTEDVLPPLPPEKPTAPPATSRFSATVEPPVSAQPPIGMLMPSQPGMPPMPPMPHYGAPHMGPPPGMMYPPGGFFPPPPEMMAYMYGGGPQPYGPPNPGMPPFY